jgi:hypothetical protein
MASSFPDKGFADIAERHQAWFKYFQRWRATYWICGIVGVIASVSAAAKQVTSAAPYFAILSSICFAVIGFTNPQRRANGYVGAWRILGTARLKYENGLCDLAALIAAVDQGEAAIAQADGVAPTLPHLDHASHQ